MICTTLYPPGRYRVRAALLSALFACLITGASFPVYAENSPAVLSVLDGHGFKGKIGSNDEPAFSDDLWTFDEGMFTSKACRGCEEGEYWLRSDSGGVRFRAETVCPDSGATLVYTGLVKDDRIEGTFTWTVNSWFGDTEKQFWFEGKRVENAAMAASQSKPSIGSCSEFANRRANAPQNVLPSIRDEFLRFP